MRAIVFTVGRCVVVVLQGAAFGGQRGDLPSLISFDVLLSAEPSSLMRRRLSFGANVVVIGGVLVPFWGLMMLGQRFGEAVVLRFWWMFLMVFIVCLTLYLWSFFSIEKTLTARREKLLNLIAGANDQ